MTVNSKSRSVTIRDVAEEANVSISTVSLYIQGKQRVSAETGNRIAAAIEKLNYVRRPRATQDAPPFFGLLIEELPLLASSDIIYNHVLHAIEAQAKAHHYGMLFSIIEEGKIPRMVTENQVRGVIVVGGSPVNDALISRLVLQNRPMVLVDNYVMGVAVDAIVPDNEGGGYAAFKHLLDLGHKRIAIIEGPRKYKTLTDRLLGALRAAEDYGHTIPPAYRQQPVSSGKPNKGYREMQQLLALPEPPTAVYAVSDKTAFGALAAIKDAGLSVPNDISIVGFDDVAESEHTIPPLTTVRVSKSEIGVLAMQRLLDLVNGKATLPVKTAVYTSLVVRQSTRAMTE